MKCIMATEGKENETSTSHSTVLFRALTVDQARYQVLGIQRKPGDSGLTWQGLHQTDGPILRWTLSTTNFRLHGSEHHGLRASLDMADEQVTSKAKRYTIYSHHQPPSHPNWTGYSTVGKSFLETTAI